MIKRIRDAFLLFLLVSIIGWVYEVVLGFIQHGVFLDRGFLWGPWLPIYGIGGLIIYAVFGRLVDKKLYVGKVNIRALTIIVYVALFATLIELAATYVMQLANIPYDRLWDYHQCALNFEGRIAPEPSLRFGLLGAMGLYIIVPLYKRFTDMKRQDVCNAISGIAFGLFLIDLLCRIPFGSNYTGPA